MKTLSFFKIPLLATLAISLITLGSILVAGLFPAFERFETLPVVASAIFAIYWSTLAFTRQRMLENADHVSDVLAQSSAKGVTPVLHHWQYVAEVWPKKGHELWTGLVVIRTELETRTVRVYGFGSKERQLTEAKPVVS